MGQRNGHVPWCHLFLRSRPVEASRSVDPGRSSPARGGAHDRRRSATKRTGGAQAFLYSDQKSFHSSRLCCAGIPRRWIRPWRRRSIALPSPSTMP